MDTVNKLAIFVVLGFNLINYSLADTNLPIKIRGIANLSGEYIFSVFNTRTNQFKWIETNQRFGELIIHSYEAADSSVKGTYQGKSIYLKLAESNPNPIENISSQVPDDKVTNRVLSKLEIEQLVNDYRKRERVRLPSETDPRYSRLKALSEKRIGEYEFSLTEKNEKLILQRSDSRNRIKRHSNIKPSIGSQRR